MIRWLLVVALAGCVLPKTTDTITPMERTARSPACGPAGGLKISATSSHGTLHVRATRSRRCAVEIWQRYAHHQSTHAEVVGPDASGGIPGDPGTALAVLAFAAPIFVVSAAFTGVALAVSPAQDEQYVKKLGVMAIASPVEAASVAVDAVMPSGATVHGMTDAHGLASLQVPDSEPETGVVVLRAGTLTGKLSYQREPLPPN